MTHSTERAEDARAHDDERDALTHMLTRQAFAEQLRARLALARCDAETFGVCLIDLDRFKNINLSHGPSRGDDVLRDVAARLVRTIKATTDHPAEPVVARYDGNAFAVITETLCLRRLETSADEVRRAITAVRSEDGAKLSASVGAALARIGEDPDNLLRRAEQALFLAKQSGRDRVEVARGAEPLRAEPIVLSLRRRA